MLVAADAIVTTGDVSLDEVDVPVFRATRMEGDPVFDPPLAGPSPTVLALAGIAAPDPFLQSLRTAGWTIAATKTVADHHPYSAGDLNGIVAAARAAGAAAVLTTEKDYVRLLPFRPFPLPIGWVPLTMEPEPRADFRQWLVSSIAAARDIVLV